MKVSNCEYSNIAIQAYPCAISATKNQYIYTYTTNVYCTFTPWFCFHVCLILPNGILIFDLIANLS